MNKAVSISIIVLAALLQESFIAGADPQWFAVNVVLVLLATFSIVRNVEMAMFTAVVGGLLLDIFSVTIFGANTIILILLVLLLEFVLTQFIEGESIIGTITAVGLVSILFIVLHEGLLYITTIVGATEGVAIINSVIVKKMIGSVIGNIVLSFLWMQLLKRIENFLSLREYRKSIRL